ncbi:DMT family transporter [Anaerotignum sp.]|uniref:DMT family transporter n=1 Tax=Anaerotignum sp. TaxID=2039241 RepID=UPI0028AC3358|nr:EamA family transporter [Anaerotignum sp.]
MNTRTLGVISAFVAVIIWGSVFTVKEYLLNFLDPSQINFINAFITTTFYLITVLITKQSLKVNKRVLCILVLSGIAGISITRLACDIGIKLVGGTAASVFSSLIPVMCVIFECIILRKSTNKVTILSILTSILGIFLVIGMPKGLNNSFIGYLWLFISNCAWILYCHFCSLISDANIKQNISMFYQFGGASLFLLPSLFTNNLDFSVLIRKEILFSLLFLGLANGVIAYGLFTFAVKSIGVLTSNVINNFIPVVTLILNFLFFQQSVGLMQFFGVSLIILSIISITLQKNIC